jgi:hypothetical protein
MPDGLTNIQAQQVRSLIQQYAVRDKNQPNQNRKQPATVLAYDDGAEFDTQVDPDEPTTGNVLFARNITGLRLDAGARVMIEFIEPHGLFVVGVTEYDEGPLGVMAIFTNDADQGPITSTVTVTNSQLDRVIPANRIIRITGFASVSTSGGAIGAGCGIVGDIEVDGAFVGRWAQDNDLFGSSILIQNSCIIPSKDQPTPLTPGSHQFRLRVARVRAFGDLTLNGSAVNTRIEIEDCGPVSRLPFAP